MSVTSTICKTVVALAWCALVYRLLPGSGPLIVIQKIDKSASEK